MKPAAISDQNTLRYGQTPQRVVYRNETSDLTFGPNHTQGFVNALNGLRMRHGLNPLRENPSLTAVAFRYAHEIKYSRHLSHIGRNGSTPESRVSRGGYSWRFVGENLASGYHTPEDVLAGWMQSISHRKNLLARRAEQFGIARVQDTWVLIVAQPKPQARPGVTYGQPIVRVVLPPR